MQRSKKQKHQHQLRKKIKTYIQIGQQQIQYIKNKQYKQNKQNTLLQKTYPNMHGLNILRILTLLEINYLISTVIDIIKKTNINLINIQDLKIGIIGGGIMGRLILNHLLVFIKQGIKPKNIMISTRQTYHLQFYIDNFHIQTFLDNKKIASECHIIIVATQATLDNWILTQLNKNLTTRLNHFFKDNQNFQNSQNSTISLLRSQMLSKSSTIQLANSTDKSKISSINVNSIVKPTFPNQKSIKQEPFNLRPLVYILTSDFNQQKCSRIFQFPVLIPSFRSQDIPKILQKIKQKFSKLNSSQQQKNNSSINNNNINLIQKFQQLMDQQLFHLIKNQTNQLQQKLNSKLQKIIETFQFFGKKIQDYWKKQQSKINLNLNANRKQKINTIREIFKIQQTYSNTFLIKCRKWKMAYNNFIA